MRLSSPHSFALLALSLFTSAALSVDSKAAAQLRPRLDDGYVASSSSTPSPTRRRKKCSSVLPAHSPVRTAVTAASTGPSSGYAVGQNSTDLSHVLPYSRSKTKCTKTSIIYAPKPTDEASPVGTTPDESGDHSSPASPAADSTTPEASGDSSVGASPVGSHDTQQYGNGSPAVGGSNGDSPQPASISSSCAPQSTVTVTNKSTVTVTVSAGSAGGGSDQNGALPNSLSTGGPAVGSTPAPNLPAEASSTSSKKKCGGKPKATGFATGTAPLSTGTGSPSLRPLSKEASSSISLAAVYNLAPTRKVKSVSSSSPLSASKYNDESKRADKDASEKAVGANVSSSKLDGELWAGATIGTLMRMEQIPQRRFYDYDGKTIKDPIKTLSDAGVNSIRVETGRGQCLGPSHFVNNASTLNEELLFALDFGCIDTQVKTAQEAVAQGMRIQLTINQGFNISKEAESYSYEEMIADIQKETKRQLQPFLDVKIVPDVILLENEGSDGILFTETSTGHVRGTNDGKASAATVDKELCGQIPTGNMVSYPQLAGYYKAEVLACNDAIKAAGLGTDTVRYGLHSHGQYVQWKEGIVHGPNPPSESALMDAAGHKCPVQVIPAEILAKNASEMLTIAGFSAYPDPIRPVDINSVASMEATLNRLTQTLAQLQADAERYGKYESGPFKGQYKLQALGVEYGTHYTPEEVDAQIAHTELMWKTVKRFPALLGLLWYEAWYCHSDWEGGQAALCRNVDQDGISGQAPKKTLQTWGSNARSPWKH